MFGVAITTRNRRDVFCNTYKMWRKYMPENAPLIVVDDASDTPTPYADYRFSRNVGVGRAKNKCIELLMDAGCDHLFLADDDVWPIVDNWWQPYIDSGCNHLMLLQYRDHRVAWERDGFRAFSHTPLGLMLYVRRAVIDTVGGMRTETKYGGEHFEWTNRIHNANLTEHPYLDVSVSGSLFDSVTDDRPSLPINYRKTGWAVGRQMVKKYAGATDFVEYREVR